MPVTIHMLRTYFNSIPESLEESATLEGCNRFQVMRYISIPLAMPAIMSTGLFVFMIAWNEFLSPSSSSLTDGIAGPSRSGFHSSQTAPSRFPPRSSWQAR